MASDKQENMAKFIRSKINKRLPEYLSGFPNISKHKYTGKIQFKHEIRNVDDAVQYYSPRWDVAEVKWGEGPGETAALSMVLNFITERLKFYGISSNDPSKDHTSKLSPWLRYGEN